MKRRVILLAVSIVFMSHVSARPLGLGISVEAGGEDLLEVGEGYEFYLQPEFTFAVGTTGLNLGLAWSVPIAPEPGIGEVELREEYIHTFPGIAFAFGNQNVFIIEDAEFEGYLYITGEHSRGSFTFEGEIETVYTPEIEALFIPGIFYAVEFDTWTIEIGLSQNILFFDELGLEETEFSLNLEFLIPGGFLSLEIEPVLTEDREFTLNGLVRVERFF